MKKLNPIPAGEIARRFNITENRVRRIARDRNIGIKVGRSWLFTEKDIELLKPMRRGRPKKG